MTNTKITADSFLDNKELREQNMERVDVLDKVKNLFLLPELECMTGSQVADYFEVELNTIQQQYQRNKSEFDEDGAIIKSISDFKKPKLTGCQFRQSEDRNGVTILCFENGTEIKLSNRGIRCYPKRAILRMGMLLRDSRVAKEVRTQLLNTFEHATEEQRTAEINNEEQLLLNAVKSMVSGDSISATSCITKYIDYKNRYIAKIEQANKDLTATNAAYTKEIQTWEFNSIINALMRTYARNVYPYDNKGFSKTWTNFYKQFKYKYNADIDARWTKNGEKGARISYIKPHEYSNAVKLAVAMCEEQGIDTGKIINEVNSQAVKEAV